MFSSKKNLRVGELEAEAEIGSRANIKLEDVFIDLIDSDNFIENTNKFLIIGGKGSGKSAIARFYKESTKQFYNKECKIITKSKLDFEKILQNMSGSISEEISEEELQKYIIEWMILNQILKLLMKSEYVKQLKEFDKLDEFFAINSGIVSINEREIIEAFKQFGGNVTLNPFNKFLRANWGKNYKFKFSKASFIKVLPDLKKKIKLIFEKIDQFVDSNPYYYTLFLDDLDHDLKNIKQHRDMLMNLIRIVKEYNIEYLHFDNVFVKIIVLIRPDMISELMEYSDSFKIIESYRENLNWYDNMDSLEKCQLKNLVNVRIKQVAKELDFRTHSDDPWYDLIEKASDKLDKTSFKWFLDQTRYRPRDLILFLNHVLTNTKKNQKITFQKLKGAKTSYSLDLWKEMKNELSFYFDYDELASIEEILAELNNWFMYEDFKKIWDNHHFENIGANRFLEILFNNSVIGNYENGHLYFKHREDTQPLKVDFEKQFILLNGIKAYFKNY